MSEFSPPESAPILETPPPPSSILGPRVDWLRRPLLLGLSLPWLAGVGVVLGLAAWHLFAPESPPTVNQLAFEGGDLQPVSSELKAPALVSAGPGLSQMQDEVAKMFGDARSFAEANRTAIERLVEANKAKDVKLAALQQQVVEVQAQISLLSARAPSSKPVVAHRRAQPAAVTPSSPLTGMRLSAVQFGMAWVYWQEKTWAVQVGDSLGSVTVTGIDAGTRQVHTSAGTLK